MREIILIRTHYCDSATIEQYEYLRATSGRDVAFVCDETNGYVDVGPGRVKIGINDDYMSSLGLYAPHNFGWLCGDYFLYAGALAFPDYDRYWLVESDVMFNMAKSSQFFDTYADPKVDVLTFHNFKSNGGWYWHKPMAYFCEEVYACLFPLVGVSKTAVEAAFLGRKQLSGIFEQIVPRNDEHRWPNDESFLMSTLISQGFKHLDLSMVERRFTTHATFNVGGPKSRTALQRSLPDGMIHHPVHAGKRFVDKARNWVNNPINQVKDPQALDKIFDSAFFEGVKLEATDEEYEEIAAMVRKKMA